MTFTRYIHTPVAMNTWEIEHAVLVGGKRIIANMERGNALHYKDQLMETDWAAQPAAVLCEAAVAKFLGIYYDWSAWSAHEHDAMRHGADLGNIEVRRMRTSPRATVRLRDVTKGADIWPAYVDMDDPRTVLVYGGASAAWLWDRSTPASFDSTGNSRQFDIGVLAARRDSNV